METTNLSDFATDPLDRYERLLAVRYGVLIPDSRGEDGFDYARARRSIQAAARILAGQR